MVLVDKGAGIYRRPPTPVPTETDVCMEAGGRDRNFPLGTISTLNWFVPQPQAPGAQSHPSIRLDHMVKSQGTVTTGSHQKPRAGPNTPGPKLESNSAEHPTTRPAWVGKLCGPPTKVLDTWDTEDTPSWEHCVAEISLEFTSQSLTGADGLSQSLAPLPPVRNRSFLPMRLQSPAQLCPRHSQLGYPPVPLGGTRLWDSRWVPPPGPLQANPVAVPHQLQLQPQLS